MATFKLAQWWEPGTADKRLAGTLVQDDAGYFRFHVDGHFERSRAQSGQPDGVPTSVHPPMDDIPILVGVTSEGKLISLIDCRVTGPVGIPGLMKTTQEFKPRLIAYDVHFASIDEFRLSSLSMRYSNLDQWVDTPGFRIEFSPSQTYSASVHYVLPEPITATLSSGLTVGVFFSATGPNFDHSRTDVHIQQNAWLRISAPDERSYEELVRAITIVADLISLGIGQPMRPIESQATTSNSESTGGPESSISFKLHHNAQPIAPLLTDVDKPRMLFNLNDLRNTFGTMLETWCVQQTHIKPLYGLYFGTLRSPQMYLEHRFLNMFRALEAFESFAAPRQEVRCGMDLRRRSQRDRTRGKFAELLYAL
jgi:ApeA N-terminal domain 1